MLAALSRKHIARAGRLGSGPALDPQILQTSPSASGVLQSDAFRLPFGIPACLHI